ncbi:hypothetical protein [Ruminococcus sp. AM31-15AC]
MKIRALYAMWCGYLQTLSSIKLLKLLKKLNVEQLEGLFTRD